MTRVVFLGSPDFAVPSLRALVAAGHKVTGVVTQPDREAGRGRRMLPPAVKVAAEELGLPVLQPASLRRPEAVAELAALRPDVLVVAAFGQILRRNVLELAPHGVLNVHASLLPRWRGASPVTAAIVAGDAATGVSIMLLDEGLDTGPVLATRESPIAEDDTGGSLTDRLAQIGAELLVEALPIWLNGTITPRPQEHDAATYAPKLEKGAGRIDWSEPAALIARKVRAYSPWPGAYTPFKGEPLRIHSAVSLSGGQAAEPGIVVEVEPDRRPSGPLEPGAAAFAVGTGDGLLLPLRLQRAGRRAIDATEFLRGERGLIGSRLDEVI
jgi:methionyl-tRNA formyltransferase